MFQKHPIARKLSRFFMVIIAMDRLYVTLGMTGKLQMMVGDSLEAFPIGAVYMSSKSTSPARVFARLMDTGKRSCTDWYWRGISRWSDWWQDYRRYLYEYTY